MMRVGVTGLRGIPDIQGGIETHCEELFPLIAERDAEVTIFCRKPCAPTIRLQEWKGLKLKWLPTIHSLKSEAFIHTFLSVMTARMTGTEILHIHACGPGLFVPLAKILGMKVVFTHHGEDYNRAKWGTLAKRILKFGERLAVRNADAVICISPHISEMLRKEYHIEPIIIPNGITPQKEDGDTSILQDLGIEENKYIISVGRLVPEKGFDLLIRAFVRSGLSDRYKLTIVGGTDYPSDYSRGLNRIAEENGIIMTGALQKKDVMTLVRNSSLFVLASSHEGLPISLLEAMSCGTDILVSDIPACRLPELEKDDFFNMSEEDLENGLRRKLNLQRRRDFNLSEYSWELAAEKTFHIYQEL